MLAKSAFESPDNAALTVPYWRGAGGFYKKEDKTNVTKDHHNKKTLCSVAEPLRAAEEVRCRETTVSLPVLPFMPSHELTAARISSW